eukprot:818552-Pelagomonas_calceolata.AAC.1
MYMRPRDFNNKTCTFITGAFSKSAHVVYYHNILPKYLYLDLPKRVRSVDFVLSILSKLSKPWHDTVSPTKIISDLVMPKMMCRMSSMLFSNAPIPRPALFGSSMLPCSLALYSLSERLTHWVGNPFLRRLFIWLP